MQYKDAWMHDKTDSTLTTPHPSHIKAKAKASTSILLLFCCCVLVIYMQWTSPDKRKNIFKKLGKETVARVTLYHCSILISANSPSHGWLDAMVYKITGIVPKLCSPQAVNHKKGRYIIHYRISAHIVQIHCCSGRQSLISGFQLLSVPFVGDIMAPNI